MLFSRKSADSDKAGLTAEKIQGYYSGHGPRSPHVAHAPRPTTGVSRVKTRTLFATVITFSALATGTAKAQTVSFSGTGYNAGGGGVPASIAPYGYFATPSYPAGNGGQFRVRVVYGYLDINGSFQAYNNVPGIPGTGYSPTKALPMGGTNQSWGIPRTNCPNLAASDQVQAQLQRTTDNGVTWSNEGTPSYHSVN